MKRVAFARVMQETNALSPVPTTLADFEAGHYVEGPALLAAATTGPEVPPLFRRAELTGFLAAARRWRADIEPVPLLSTWASSGGPLEPACFDELQGRLVEALRRAGRLDGVYLALHGAMGVRGVVDPESHLLRSVREVIGGAPLVVSHDLHGNVTRARVAAVDALVAYRTNPHRDHARTGARAARLVIGMALGEVRPVMAWRSLPILLGGGLTIDFLAPMRAVFRRMDRAERAGEALAAATLMVHPWSADPQLGWSTVAITDGDPAAAERLADELAELCWARRHAQPPAFSSAEDAIAAARAARWRRKLGCVTLSDASDVVPAGAPGDSTHLLRALLAQASGLRCYAAVRDPAAVAALWGRAPGTAVSLPIGGGLDPARSAPLPVEGAVVSRHAQQGYGRTVVLAVAHLRIVVTEGPAIVMRPAFYRAVGLSIWRADIVVVKSLFPFLMYFLPYSRKTIFVRTRGASDFDAAFQLTFDGPMHPRDPVDDWRARDRARRGLAPVGAPAP